MIPRTRVSILLLVACALAPTALRAHCQIPCGIYGDEARFTAMLEDVATIEKSINEINRLAGEAKPDWNQSVRWVMNKEHHADQLTETVTYYFMAQRIKPKEADDAEAHAKYVHELTLLHKIMVQAMKAKQGADPATCERLRDLIGKFQSSYLGEHSH